MCQPHLYTRRRRMLWKSTIDIYKQDKDDIVLVGPLLPAGMGEVYIWLSIAIPNIETKVVQVNFYIVGVDIFVLVLFVLIFVTFP